MNLNLFEQPTSQSYQILDITHAVSQYSSHLHALFYDWFRLHEENHKEIMVFYLSTCIVLNARFCAATESIS